MTYQSALIESALAFLCDVAAVQDSFFGSLRTIPRITQVDQAASAIRDTLFRSVCNREPPPPPPGLGPNEAQCSLVYQIFFTGYEILREEPTRVSNRSDAVWGPINSFRYATTPGGEPNFQFEVLCRGRGSAPTPAPVWEVLFTSIFSRPRAVSMYVQVDSISPLNGQPDNCGPPTRPLPPFLPGADRRPVVIPYIDASGNQVNLVGFAALGAAFVDADLNISFPVSFNLRPSFSLNPSASFNIDVNFNLGGKPPVVSPPYEPGPLPRNPTSPTDRTPLPRNPWQPRLPSGPDDSEPEPDPTTPAPPPGIPDDPPRTPPTRRAIIGAIVTTTSIPSGSSPSVVFQGDNPDVYVPDLGLISFRISAGNGVTGWTEDIRIKNRRQFVPCPWPQGAVEVKGTPRGDIQFIVSPVYGSVTSPVTA